MRIALIIGILLILSACGGKNVIPPAPKVVEIQIPYAVPCIEKMPDRPFINSDFELLEMGDYDFVQAIHKDRLVLDKYSLQLEAALQACRDFE